MKICVNIATYFIYISSTYLKLMYNFCLFFLNMPFFEEKFAQKYES